MLAKILQNSSKEPTETRAEECPAFGVEVKIDYLYPANNIKIQTHANLVSLVASHSGTSQAQGWFF